MAAVAPSTEHHPLNRLGDDTVDGVTVRPSIPEQPKQKGIRLQTDKLSLVNRRSQAFDFAEIEIQTTGVGVGTDDPDEAHATEEDLLAFLSKVTPLMQEELGNACVSLPIFESYEPNWDDRTETCDMTQQLYKEGLVDLEITAVAWNSTGNVLACSFGKLDTMGWCEVNAPVCLWNVFRPNIVAGEPDTSIQVNGFCMSLAFHPTQPAVLAGGTYNGELLIWNTASTDLDPLVAASSIDDYFHREAIQAVEWILADLSGGQDAYLVATVSGDGKVLIWDAREHDLSYPSRGFVLLGSKKKVLGGRSLSFSPLDPWLFVVGCETGTIMRAFRPPPAASVGKPAGQYVWKPSAVALLDQLAASSRLQLQNHVENYCRVSNIKDVTADVIFQSKPDPVVIFPAPKTTDLEPHAGPVVVATFSPFHRKLLLTGSTDGCVKLYDVLQQRALMTFFPPSKHLSASAVSAACWSSARPCVFAVAMEMGGVYIYDLLQSRQAPVMQLPLTGAGSQRVTTLTFNPKQRGLLAAGDDNGRVRVFRLPFKLSEQQKDENSYIGKLLASTGAGK
eukprot:TRINITY_DN90200_c0_g1_i1.p1 TRINITY_DN90200_c0_g1~~TRINITY_DN90200_c0_g1_i1.p1  ORF type:complete len:562 (-),score=86.08 TRINITY_DN90200_c0_g1_i1:56-1741(-)